MDILFINDIALTRVDALLAVKLLRGASVPILGGDLYFERDGRIELDSASWCTDPKPGEGCEDYLARGWSNSEAFIKKIPEPSHGTVLFSIVIGKLL